MKKILLTGSGGFIGQALKTHLSKDFDLLTPRSKELNLLDETSVRQYLKTHPVDLIIHSAAVGVRITPNATMQEVALPNILMFENLAKQGIALITFGSGAEYDKSRSICHIKEKDFGSSVPQDPYGYAKYQISKQIQHLEHVINLRIFGIYGPRENPSRVTSYMLNQILHDRNIELSQDVKFSFIFIDDFCQIVKHFAHKFPNEKFINISCGEDIEISRLAEISKQISRSSVRIIFKKSGLNKEYTCDTQILRQLIPTLRFTSYLDGLHKQYAYLRSEMEKERLNA